jgi:hypothetical protein
MKKSAPAEAQIHYDKTLCFIRRMEEFRSWYSSCCRMERVANVVYPERKSNMRYWPNLKRTERYKEHTAAMEERARAEADANPDGPFRDVLVQFPKNPKVSSRVTSVMVACVDSPARARGTGCASINRKTRRQSAQDFRTAVIVRMVFSRE